MWFGRQSPFGGQMMPGGGMGQQGMTPGSGMPPFQQGGMGPMSMAPRQVGPFQGMNMPAPPPAQQPQSPINPMQMGMLSQMLMQQTKKPPMANPHGTAAGPPAAGGIPSPLSAAGQNMTPEQLARLVAMLGPGFLGGAI